MLIAIFSPPNAHSLEVSGTRDVFAEAIRQAPDRVAYEVWVVAETPGPIVCSSGLTLLPDSTICEADETVDTLLVVGPRDVPTEPPSAATIEWLRKRAAGARRFGSVCTGAFLLGAAGLLDGRRVTTHWSYVAQLAAAFPRAAVEVDSIFVRDGPLFTSAGVTAGIDLALSLVEEDYGRAVALAVARQLVMFLKRPGGQSQFSHYLATQMATRSRIQQISEGIVENPQLELSVAALARRAGMSPRNFSRLFRRDFGTAPAAFVEAVRIDAARRALEETDLQVQQIAANSGFSGSASMRRAFLRTMGVSPHDYRARFRSTNPPLPAAEPNRRSS